MTTVPVDTLCSVLNFFFSPNYDSRGQGHLRSHFTADINAQAVTHWWELAKNESQSQGQLMTITTLDRFNLYTSVNHGLPNP